ncbi:FAD binding domain-containing protein [Methylobacterium brachythecii]|uniref:CO/xanthine dehydrogenase FAD-binding subunit n=1 Tax=Methylobacterium brachythecii TaxID=1176177 RepID=A0A7W6ALM8_9HYPH|nr:FAD binding domain-containing protein [Methylobacterium brachythecii]MBB3904014.1 CO/xanthine dehydrogenase FAD-binding subunit [Methylobacterium brachythecii]GLS42755.1 FAD-binding molybdopterin dehydrogenase [Methylobacterium brachythecii]
MDLSGITSIIEPKRPDVLPDWQDGDAWLAGGTWLFSEPQPHLRRLIDLAALEWAPSTVSDEGLALAATCTIAQLDRLELPSGWIASPLIGECCRALLGSFKIWNRATVGGNLCMALPAGPMIALTAALDGVCTIVSPNAAERRVSVIDFVLGPQKTTLGRGEILRSISMPAEALGRRTAFRRISLSPNGRSGALVIGTLDADQNLTLTITASTRCPVQIAIGPTPSADTLREEIAGAIAEADWYDDVHGAPDWRRHVTLLLAEEIRRELAR